MTKAVFRCQLSRHEVAATEAAIASAEKTTTTMLERKDALGIARRERKRQVPRRRASERSDKKTSASLRRAIWLPPPVLAETRGPSEATSGSGAMPRTVISRVHANDCPATRKPFPGGSLPTTSAERPSTALSTSQRRPTVFQSRHYDLVKWQPAPQHSGEQSRLVPRESWRTTLASQGPRQRLAAARSDGSTADKLQ